MVGKLFLNKQLAHALLQDRLVHPLRVLDMKLLCKTWLAHHLRVHSLVSKTLRGGPVSLAPQASYLEGWASRSGYEAMVQDRLAHSLRVLDMRLWPS